MITTIKPTYCFLLLAGLSLIASACKKQGSEPEPDPRRSDVLAFPGADGAGKFTTGGRGTAVYVVNSLEDDINNVKIGTLRKAVQATGNRIIVFTVAGRIDLSGELQIKSGNVTIMGQSAPGDGICISGYPMVVKADNVIIRFMRFRMGDLKGKEGDALTIEKNHKNIIIDHCSCSWSTDECLSIYGVENATVQYCFITEALRASVHAKGCHGYAGIWGGKNTTFHHNLLAHHDSRNPRFDHDYVTIKNVGPTDYINNVVYNWGGNSAYGGESASNSGNLRQYNFISNYYKPGPSTKNGVKTRLLNPTTKCDNCAKSPGGSIIPGKFYIVGNYMYGSPSVTADNWSGVFPDESSKKPQCKSDTRFTFNNAYISEQTAEEAFETVLSKAGCSLHRDAIDTRIVGEVRDGTGKLIDTQGDDGWPEYKTYDVKKDSDYDNISDEWEIENGLDPNNGEDAKLATLFPPYMNIEVYLNDLVKHLY